MVSIDIACGWESGRHNPEYADVNLDINFSRAKKEFMDNLKNPIIASADRIPIRDNVIDNLSANAILEHLPKPEMLLEDSRRIMRARAIGKFIIPIITSHFKYCLYLFFIAFPFSIIEIKGSLPRFYRNRNDLGFAHIRDVKPKDIIRYFGQWKITKVRYRHKWFYGWWGKLIKKFLTRGREPIKCVQGVYIVQVRK